MRDPVSLPNGTTCDRKVIERYFNYAVFPVHCARHLLSDPTDPFTRAPLTKDMLKPNTELKEKIEAFIAERTQRK